MVLVRSLLFSISKSRPARQCDVVFVTDELDRPYGRSTGHSGLTCRSTSGLTEISPLNGRSWLTISSTDTATPVAKIPIAIAAAARLSQWTIAIAISVQPAG